MPPPESPIGMGSRTSSGGLGRAAKQALTTITGKVTWDGLKGLIPDLTKVESLTSKIAANFERINTQGRAGASVLGRLGGIGGVAGQTGSTRTSNTWLTDVMQRQGIGPTAGGGRQVAGPGGSMGWANDIARPPTTTGPRAAPSAAAQTAGTTGAPSVSTLGKPPAPVPVGAGAGGGGGGTTPAAAGAAAAGAGGNTMPWAARLGFTAMTVAPQVANMLSGRIGRNMAESIPLSAQATLTASMYGGNANSIEMQRFRALGQFAGSRQDVAQTASMALRFGQTPQQANQFMQGIGTTVQAFGGTATASQLTNATAGFLDPMVMRRQRAMGMQYSRVGGQVRPPMEIAQDYIKNYERRFNGGRKLNQFDFINLGTPGAPLRIRFQQLYGLDDATIDTFIVTAGLQQSHAGGDINYNSSAALSALGLNTNRLGLQAASTQTTMAHREAQFGQQMEGGMVNQLQMEERIQNALAGVEDATSGLINEFASLERVVKVLTTGLGVLGGIGLARGMGGGGGGGGGGGLLSGVLGGGGRGGAAAAAGAAEGEVAAGVAGGGMGMAAKGGLLAGGAIAGIGAITTAVNAKGWGDIFSAGAQGAASGAMIGSAFGQPLIGAAGGFIIASGGAAISALLSGRSEGQDKDRRVASLSASNMTERSIIDEFKGHQQGSLMRWNGDPMAWKDFTSFDPYYNGIIDKYQIRRAALTANWMDEVSHMDGFGNFIKLKARMDGASEEDVANQYNEALNAFREMAGSTDGKVDDGKYEDAMTKVNDLTELMRWDKFSNVYEGAPDLIAKFHEYFPPPFVAPSDVRPNYSPAMMAVYDQYAAPVEDIASAQPAQTGDPSDTTTSTATDTSGQYSFVNRMPMAQEPSDASWNGMHPIMKKRILAMIAGSHGKVHWEPGGGTRSEAEQRAMFLDRYRPGPGRDQVEWNGQTWHHVKLAVAAPPGRSMHEIGLAADMGGDMGWIKSHSKEYGLRSFWNVNSEPWHVQPAELPGSRRDYEAAGLNNVWGTTAGTDTGGGAATVGDEGSKTGGSMGANIASGISGTSGALIGGGGSSLALLSGGAPGFGGGGGGGGASDSASPDTTSDYSGGVMTGDQVAKMAYEVGFRGQGLINVIGITNRESNWDPSAHNTNAGTGDNSYGLAQINMLGSLGPERAKLFGITDYNALLNPRTNLEAMFKLSGNGSNFGPWLDYRPGLELSAERINTATEIVKRLHLGDAVFDRGRGVGQGGALSASEQSTARAIISRLNLGDPVGAESMVGSAFGGSSPAGRLAAASQGGMRLGGGGGINVHVTIQSSGNYAYDAKRLATAVRPAFEAEYAEVTAKRST